MSVSYSVGVLSDVVVDVLFDALAVILSGVISVVTDNGVDRLFDVNAKGLEAVMTVWEFGASPAPL